MRTGFVNNVYDSCYNSFTDLIGTVTQRTALTNLLLEDGSFLLLEDGFKITLTEAV